MTMKPSRTLLNDLAVVVAAALAATGWNAAFAWWSRQPALQIYELMVRHFEVNDVLVVMGTDVLFALLCGLIAAELFVRLVRPAGYRPEALAVIVFLLTLFGPAWLQDPQAARFLLRLPPLWLTLLGFGIRVGYGIKAERKRLAAAG